MPESLVHADQALCTMCKGYIHVQARSRGTSLLLLPLQYSHCLQLETDDTSDSPPRLIRVNLMQAGLVFAKSFEGRLRFANGSFANPYGRIQDYFEMKAFGLHQIQSAK